MVQLQNEAQNFEAAGLQVVGISPDTPEKLKQFASSKSVKFPLLSDPESQVIEAFGILYQRGLPQPGTFVIDSSGMIRAKLFLEGYQQRHTTDELLETARKLQAVASESS